jgi:hypothetical protein
MDEPKTGKIYSLTGSGKSIANGNSWAESEVILYRVEIVEIATGEVVSVIGNDLTERQAEKRELTGLSRIDRENFFVRTVKQN